MDSVVAAAAAAAYASMHRSSSPSSSGGKRARATNHAAPPQWSEHSTLVLLDALAGRKILRAGEWTEVADKVRRSGSEYPWSETQCRKRLDNLKERYKRELARMTVDRSWSTKWVYFTVIDELMSRPEGATMRFKYEQERSLDDGGGDSESEGGDAQSDRPSQQVYRGNNHHSMYGARESSEDTGTEDEDDVSDRPPPRKERLGSGIGVLADSIRRFSEVFEKVRKSERQQMAEIKRMGEGFHRELEVMKRQILERARVEIARLNQEEEEERDQDQRMVMFKNRY